MNIEGKNRIGIERYRLEFTKQIMKNQKCDLYDLMKRKVDYSDKWKKVANKSEDWRKQNDKCM